MSCVTVQVLWPVNVLILWSSGLGHYVIWNLDAKILWELAAFIFSMRSAYRSRMYPPGLHSVTTLQASIGRYLLLLYIVLLDDTDTLMTELSIFLVIRNILWSKYKKKRLKNLWNVTLCLWQVVPNVLKDCSVFNWWSSSPRRILFLCCFALKTKTPWSFKHMGTTDRMTQLHISENFNLLQHHCEKLRYCLQKCRLILLKFM